MTRSKRNVIAYKDLPPALGLTTIAVAFLLLERLHAPALAYYVYIFLSAMLISSAIVRFMSTEQVSIVPQTRTGPAPATEKPLATPKRVSDEMENLQFHGEIEITREGEFLTVNVVHKGKRIFGFAPQPVQNAGTMVLRGIEIRMRLAPG